MREAEGFHSAQRLHQMLLARNTGVGLATMYRTLQLLVESGEVDSTRLPGGEQLFRRCGQSQHHHHLVCRECGRTVEAAGPAVERWADQVAAQHGFTDVGHSLELAVARWTPGPRLVTVRPERGCWSWRVKGVRRGGRTSARRRW